MSNTMVRVFAGLSAGSVIISGSMAYVGSLGPASIFALAALVSLGLAIKLRRST